MAEPALECIGWDRHEWTLEIESGKPSLASPECGPACMAHTVGDVIEWLYVPEMRVTIRMATECPAYPVDDLCRPTGKPTPLPGYEQGSHYIAHGSRCDCNWWPVAEVIRP